MMFAAVAGHGFGRATPSLRNAPPRQLMEIVRGETVYRNRNAVQTNPATSQRYSRLQIIVELFDQLAFRADAVEHLQQQRAQQLLRGNRGAAFARIKPPEARTQLLQNIANKLLDPPQRMVLRDSLLRRDIGEQAALVPEPAAHRLPAMFAATDGIIARRGASRGFSANC